MSDVALIVDELTALLRAHAVPEPVQEAREIIAALYDVPRFWPVVNAAVPVEMEVAQRARRAAALRARGAPLAYAVGRAAFRHLMLDVDERVLIPRPETELLVDLVFDALAGRTGGVAVDVGAGSGAIALALAAEGSFSRVYGIDISRDALAVARRNACLTRAICHAPVDLLHGSLLAPVSDVPVRVVVSNPPYISFEEAAALPTSVRDWEPPVALFSGGDGLSITARLVREAAEVLEPDGVLALEVDIRRASLVADLVGRDRRFRDVRVQLDLTGRERFVLARRQERG